jgi:hypothetical protein
MFYFKVALCIVGMSLYFNAGKIDAQNGEADHSILWASLSLLVSTLAFWAGAGWLLWLLAQIGLFIGIALVRVVLDKNHS